MTSIQSLIDILLHLDTYLDVLITSMGSWSYILLFAIVFLETGFVVTPFLPGDSLLFVAGALASRDLLSVWWLYAALVTAAIVGDTVNYWIGHFLGPKVFARDNARFFKKEYLEKTRGFYEKYGGKTIIIARFIPIIRTFAPFVAGIGNMHYKTFIFYNIAGGLAWVTLFLWGGYFFGNLAFVQDNFHTVVLVIIFLSILPGIFEFVKHKLSHAKERSASINYKKLETTFHEEHLSD